jgi:hypothetical protein
VYITASVIFRLGEDETFGPILIRKMLKKSKKGRYDFDKTLIKFCSIPEVRSQIMKWENG